MAEQSMFWTTNNTGDGPSSGYAAERWQSLLHKLFISNAGANAGVLFGVDNDLLVSGTASPLTVASGAAIVYNSLYENTSPLNLAVTTPVIGTTGGVVVLRVAYAAQTVRAVAIRNTDGVSGIPALTQTPGATYEIPLATFTITTGGVITLTDTRVYAKISTQIRADQFAVNTVQTALGYTPVNKAGDLMSGSLDVDTQALLADTLYASAQLEVKADGVADPTAVPAIGFHRKGQIGAALYLNSDGLFRLRYNNGTDYNLWSAANIAALRRQGGNSGDWRIPGTTDYTPAIHRTMVGSSIVSMPAGQSSTSLLITLPAGTFTAAPIVTGNRNNAQSGGDAGNTTTVDVAFTHVTGNPNQFFLTLTLSAPVGGSPVIFHIGWIAIGPTA